FFIQAAMDVMFKNWGIPTLTGPFCVATWLFLLPLYRLDNKRISAKTAWRDYQESMGDDQTQGNDN
ncbi:MAG: urea transporter, partial [Muribaculaceae bacterium]|nr:urea transporter [Muribaculaceae bacterium]